MLYVIAAIVVIASLFILRSLRPRKWARFSFVATLLIGAPGVAAHNGWKYLAMFFFLYFSVLLMATTIVEFKKSKRATLP